MQCDMKLLRSLIVRIQVDLQVSMSDCMILLLLVMSYTVRDLDSRIVESVYHSSPIPIDCAFEEGTASFVPAPSVQIEKSVLLPLVGQLHFLSSSGPQ